MVRTRRRELEMDRDEMVTVGKALLVCAGH